MQIQQNATVPSSRLRAQDCDLAVFRQLIEVDTDLDQCQNASEVTDGVPIYQPARLVAVDATGMLDELADVLVNGPGILVVRAAVAMPVIDRVDHVFSEIIEEQRAAGGAAGDHFAAAGANDRVWNSLEKLCLRDPEAFAAYYENETLAQVCTAFLGPRYQVSAQVNQVNPGAAAQDPHRDYHLGFLTDEQAELFPAHVHRLSPVLTLQAAVAHCDMPVETGPTMYLPHSQKYLPGYLAWRRPDFKEYFEDNHTQLALGKGDLVFFNPALFHAAGTNSTSDIVRRANLLQISSAFGRAMERIDRTAMVMALYPVLRRWVQDGTAPDRVQRVIAAAAEGYAFPNNLDHDQPLDGLAPESMADKVANALTRDLEIDQMRAAVEGLA